MNEKTEEIYEELCQEEGVFESGGALFVDVENEEAVKLARAYFSAGGEFGVYYITRIGAVQDGAVWVYAEEGAHGDFVIFVNAVHPGAGMIVGNTVYTGDRSVKTVREQLERDGCSPEEIEEIIALLLEDGEIWEEE